MKSSRVERTSLLQCSATSDVYPQARRVYGIKGLTITDAAFIIAVVAAVLALYAAIFIGLYRWSHDAPLFPPDGATAARLESYSLVGMPMMMLGFNRLSQRVRVIAPLCSRATIAGRNVQAGRHNLSSAFQRRITDSDKKRSSL
jgi:hypothetical protein